MYHRFRQDLTTWLLRDAPNTQTICKRSRFLRLIKRMAVFQETHNLASYSRSTNTKIFSLISIKTLTIRMQTWVHFHQTILEIIHSGSRSLVVPLLTLCKTWRVSETTPQETSQFQVLHRHQSPHPTWWSSRNQEVDNQTLYLKARVTHRTVVGYTVLQSARKDLWITNHQEETNGSQTCHRKSTNLAKITSIVEPVVLLWVLSAQTTLNPKVRILGSSKPPPLKSTYYLSQHRGWAIRSNI